MGNSIADPAIKIKLMLDHSTAEQVNAEINAVLQKAVTGATPVFKKIEEALTASVSKVDISSQLVRQLETGVKALKKTGGTEELIRQFAELDRAAVRWGDTMIAQSARIAKAVAETGLSNKNAITAAGSENVAKRRQELEAMVARAETYSFNEIRQESRVRREREQTLATENKLRNMQGQFGAPVAERVDLIGPLTATVRQQQDRKKYLEAKVNRAYESSDRDIAAEKEARRQEVRQFAGEKKLGRIWEAVHKDEEIENRKNKERNDAVSRAETHSFNEIRQESRLKKADEENIQRLNKKQQALDAGFTSTGIGNNSAGWDPAKRARIEAHSAKDLAQLQADALVQQTKLARQLERIGEDPAIAFANMRLPAYQDQGERIGQSLQTQQSQRNRDMLASMQSQRQTVADPPRRGAFNQNSFRFVSQQVGFGIDDAIQSYHYGGIGASARAASNNITAIAGMGISNPVVAAGTVVALSIATAALPIVLRKFGMDEDTLKARAKTAEAGYQGDGSVAGAIRRNTLASSTVTKQLEHIQGLADQAQADDYKFNKARKFLLDSGEWENSVNEALLPQNLTKKSNTGNVEKDVAYNLLKKMTLEAPEKAANWEFQWQKGQFGFADAQFAARRKEGQLIADSNKSNELNNVVSTEAYRKVLEKSLKKDLEVISDNPLMSDVDKRTEAAKRQVQFWEESSQRTRIAAEVKANRYRKEDMYDEYGTGNPLEQLQQGFKRSKRAINDNVLLSQQEHENLTKLDREQFNARYTRSLQDQRLENLDVTDPIAIRKLQSDRKNEDYDKMLARGQIAPDDVQRLKQSNDIGFSNFRARAIDDMLHENDINNPLGDLGHKFTRAAEDLQKRFAEGEYSPDEQAQMEGNLKRKYEASKRELDKPQGTERFSADVNVVGSAADNELRARMLGTFTAGGSDDSWKKQTLEEMRRSALAAEALNRKLEFARLKL